MCLSEHEICTSYKTALNKMDQLTVIHELTLLPKNKIAEILEKNGIECIHKKKIVKSKKGEKKGYVEYKFDTNKVEELYNKGLVDKEISEETGINRSSIAHWRRVNNLENNFEKRMEKAKTQIPLLFQQGYTISDIALKLGISEATIYIYKKDNKMYKSRKKAAQVEAVATKHTI